MTTELTIVQAHNKVQPHIATVRDSISRCATLPEFAACKTAVDYQTAFAASQAAADQFGDEIQEIRVAVAALRAQLQDKLIVYLAELKTRAEQIDAGKALHLSPVRVTEYVQAAAVPAPQAAAIRAVVQKTGKEATVGDIAKLAPFTPVERKHVMMAVGTGAATSIQAAIKTMPAQRTAVQRAPTAVVAKPFARPSPVAATIKSSDLAPKQLRLCLQFPRDVKSLQSKMYILERASSKLTDIRYLADLKVAARDIDRSLENFRSEWLEFMKNVSSV